MRRKGELLQDIQTSLGRIPGQYRCGAVGLIGELFGIVRTRHCSMTRKQGDSVYCEYHDKVQTGLLEPDTQAPYPVWPLPKGGYVLEEEEIAA